jgi:hypothetical protein
MPCLLVLLIMAFPRVVLACMWLFTTMLQHAYHGLLIPLLGFFFLPITTIVYAWLVNQGRPLDGINLVILIVAVLLDAGSHSGGHNYYRGRRN